MEPFRIPLFPLPMVLFPWTLVPLHIFELRYRELVKDVMGGNKQFGLLYHDPDESGPFMNEEGQLGTLAEIRRHQPLPDGRSMLLVRGLDRFRILHEVAEAAPYYEAMVVPYEDEPEEDRGMLLARRKRSLDLFKSVLQTQPHVPDALPAFSLKREISFRLAALVRMDPFWQKELLEMRREVERLDRLDPIFQANIERWWENKGSEA